MNTTDPMRKRHRPSSLFRFGIFSSIFLLGVRDGNTSEPFPEPAPKVKTYDLEISPAGEPTPALKYKFNVDLTESTPGNAAIFYNRAIIANLPSNRSASGKHWSETDWFDAPLDRLPLDEVKKLLSHKQIVLDEVKSASYCETCDWGVRFQDLRGMNAIEVRLMEFQETRDLARLLRVKARLAIAEKRFDDAIEAIRQSYQLSRNLASAPIFISGLISIAVRSITAESVMELISAEGSPNCYWALRSLTGLYEESVAALRLESTMAFRVFPFLKDAETAQRPTEEWNRLLTNAIVSLDESHDHSADSLKTRVQVASMIIKAYPIAKRELVAAGFDLDRLEQMPVGQVIAIYAGRCYQHVSDEFVKWNLVPFPQGYGKLRSLQDEFGRDGYMVHGDSTPWHDPLLVNNRLFPAIVQYSQACNRQRFTIAALTVVEAVRMHAAANNNQLPGSLDEVTIVPVPLDPSTGKQFLYRVVDHKAELLVPPSGSDEYSGRRYLFRMRTASGK